MSFIRRHFIKNVPRAAAHPGTQDSAVASVAQSLKNIDGERCFLIHQEGGQFYSGLKCLGPVVKLKVGMSMSVVHIFITKGSFKVMWKCPIPELSSIFSGRVRPERIGESGAGR